MQINKNNELELLEVQMDGAKKVKKRILIGPKDKSENIVMRHFIVAPGGHTTLHKHNYEHIIQIQKGKGRVVDDNGVEHEVTAENSIFIPSNEIHQLKNPYEEDLEFLCIILNQKN